MCIISTIIKISVMLNLMIHCTCGDITTNVVNALGYPIQKHRIETSDGFKIMLHRIPFSYDKVLENGYPEKTVLLVHGILCSSTMWVTNMNSNATALAFMLSDAGYDVWMLNLRGASVSMERKKELPDDKFWDFSWHEMGMEDIPKAIDYVLEKSKKRSINYVCHSQGCTAFLVALSMKPEYNSKIHAAYFLGPTVYMSHIKGALPQTLRRRRNNALFSTLKSFGWYAIQAHNNSFSHNVRALCHDRRTIRICTAALTNMIGPVIDTMDQQQFLLFLFKYVGDNSSLKTFTHFIQLMRSGKFQMFDYGVNKNKELYSADTPPEYNLTAVTLPISIMRAADDSLSTKKDIQTLTSKLINAKTVIALPGNHIDYIFDSTTITAIKDHMLSVMNNEVDLR